VRPGEGRDRRGSAEGRDRRRSASAGRRSWDGTPERPARTRGGDRSFGDRVTRGSRSRTARAETDQARDRAPRGRPASGGSAAYPSGPRESGPRLPDTITAQQLDPEARAQLHSLPNDLADTVARYLVAAGMAEDPERGYEYAQAARRLAARVGVVREAAGIAAYQTGRWAEALSELRAARRLTGSDDALPLMADSERALGRLDRALALIREADTGTLDRATQIELRIVESGIRRDQGLTDAAVIALQVPELTSGRLRPWSARLFYAYADALLAAGRTQEARDAFARAAAADADGETDAADRLDELDGIEVTDLAESDDPEDVTADPV
jgi:tetratricopeptide (TPR) repeat protein